MGAKGLQGEWESWLKNASEPSLIDISFSLTPLRLRLDLELSQDRLDSQKSG
jgi:hypothetical protein